MPQLISQGKCSALCLGRQLRGWHLVQGPILSVKGRSPLAVIGFDNGPSKSSTYVWWRWLLTFQCRENIPVPPNFLGVQFGFAL